MRAVFKVGEIVDLRGRLEFLNNKVALSLWRLVDNKDVFLRCGYQISEVSEDRLGGCVSGKIGGAAHVITLARFAPSREKKIRIYISGIKGESVTNKQE